MSMKVKFEKKNCVKDTDHGWFNFGQLTHEILPMPEFIFAPNY